MDRRQYWDEVYRQKSADEVSWYQATARSSLELIGRCGLMPESPVIDVGGGASVLSGELLERGFQDITVVDVSDLALEQARARLAERAGRVAWLRADVTTFRAGRRYALWHDRAVFHFLTRAEDRRAYREVLQRTLLPGGWVIIATFAADGPRQCSGLDVIRYDPEDLAAELGECFVLCDTLGERHVTPAGAEQHFVYCRFRRTA